MFSGIVEGRGEVLEVSGVVGAARRLVVDVSVLRRKPRRGASVCVQGVCLTVVSHKAGRAYFDVIGETLRCSTLGELEPGDLVNLEGSLRLGDEIGGHQVQGHVDGVGSVSRVERRQDETWMTFRAPAAVLETLAPKGWVSVDGVSLTVNRITAQTFSVGLIPETLRVTSLGDAEKGTRVNLEGDPVGKHVHRWLSAREKRTAVGFGR